MKYFSDKLEKRSELFINKYLVVMLIEQCNVLAIISVSRKGCALAKYCNSLAHFGHTFYSKKLCVSANWCSEMFGV